MKKKYSDSSILLLHSFTWESALQIQHAEYLKKVAEIRPTEMSSVLSAWTEEENKMFESALAIFDENTPNRWFEVASMIPGKTEYDVINQYKELVSDVSDIEAGLVPVPGYLAPTFTWELDDHHRGFDALRKRGRTCDQERRKGVPWTEEEHRRFLVGLEKHGKGDWRNISRNFVKSKTSTQVASHAQKYYLRQLSYGKDKRRPSIHDITTIHQHNPYSEPKSYDSLLAYPYNNTAINSRYTVNLGGFGSVFHTHI